jgi:Protein of unknown function (DUF2726)
MTHMPEYAFSWIVVLSLAVIALSIALGWSLWRGRRMPAALPEELTLVTRPVFSSEERRLLRLLREALPHHVLLSRLPLERFCQPSETKQAPLWADVVEGLFVSFAVCSANGRVLVAIDLDTDRGPSLQRQQLKHAALDACRVRYLRLAADQLPSVSELQALVPHAAGSAPAVTPSVVAAPAVAMPPAPVEMPEVAAAPPMPAVSAPYGSPFPYVGPERRRPRSREDEPAPGRSWDDVPTLRSPWPAELPRPGSHPRTSPRRPAMRPRFGTQVPADEELSEDIAGIVVDEPESRQASQASSRWRR